MGDAFLRSVGPCYVLLGFGLVFTVAYSLLCVVLPLTRDLRTWQGFGTFAAVAFVFGNIGFNYVMSVRTDPGSPMQRDVQVMCAEAGAAVRRWCDKCRCPKPDLTHHCSVCKRCVLRMDHHCPWIHNCVGHRNYRYFFNFLFWLWCGCMVTVWHTRGAALGERGISVFGMARVGGAGHAGGVFLETPSLRRRHPGGSTPDPASFPARAGVRIASPASGGHRHALALHGGRGIDVYGQSGGNKIQAASGLSPASDGEKKRRRNSLRRFLRGGRLRVSSPRAYPRRTERGGVLVPAGGFGVPRDVWAVVLARVPGAHRADVHRLPPLRGEAQRGAAPRRDLRQPARPGVAKKLAGRLRRARAKLVVALGDAATETAPRHGGAHRGRGVNEE